MIVEINKEINAVEDQIAKLSEKIEELNNINTEEKSSSEEEALIDAAELFTPDWSVMRSEVCYVDANLAYHFADATQNANIMLGFTTLFLGSAIGFGSSLATSNTKSQRNIFSTSLIFTIILTIIFLILTVKFMRKSPEIKNKLFDGK